METPRGTVLETRKVRRKRKRMEMDKEERRGGESPHSAGGWYDESAWSCGSEIKYILVSRPSPTTREGASDAVVTPVRLGHL